MKNFETNKRGMIIPLVISAIFLAIGLIALFFPSGQTDTAMRYIICGAFVTFGLVIGIGGIIGHLKEKRENQALNDFIKQCGKNAFAIFTIYIKTDDQLIFDSAEKALKTGDTSIGLAKLLKTDTTIHYAVICDEGIYFIPFKGATTPEKNVFYKRDSLPQHIVTVNEKGMIVLACPEIKMLFVAAVKNTSDADRNIILNKLNDLYGNTVQKDAAL